jgi:hypothetical protein
LKEKGWISTPALRPPLTEHELTSASNCSTSTKKLKTGIKKTDKHLWIGKQYLISLKKEPYVQPTPTGADGSKCRSKRSHSCCVQSGKNVNYGGIYDGFVDKDNIPPRMFETGDGVRLVPGGSSVRRGAYVADGVIIMPPAYEYRCLCR